MISFLHYYYIIQIVGMEEKSLYDRFSEREKLEIFLNWGYEVDNNRPTITEIALWRSVFSLHSDLHNAINNLSDLEVKQFTFLFQHSFITSFPDLEDLKQFLREKVIFYSLKNIQGYNPASKKPNDKKRVLYIYFQSIQMKIDLTLFLAFRDRAPDFIFVLDILSERSKFSPKNYAKLLSFFSPSIPAITFDNISHLGHRDDVHEALFSLQNALSVGTLKHCSSRIYESDDEIWNVMLTPDFNIVQTYHYIKELPQPDTKTANGLSVLEQQLKTYPEVDSVLVIFQDPFYHDNEEISNVERFIEVFPFLFSLEILAETLFLPLEQHRTFLVRYQESILRFWKKCYFCLNKSYLTLFECISTSLFYQNDFSSFLNQGLYDPRLFFLIISMVPEVASLYAEDSGTDEDYF